jgi:hypothetical protein
LFVHIKGTPRSLSPIKDARSGQAFDAQLVSKIGIINDPLDGRGDSLNIERID